jgi:glycosyltransferase involved in cell wall biosynthesis
MRTLFLSSMCLFEETRFGGAKRLYYYARELQRLGGLHLVCIDGCREVGDRPFGPPEFPDHLYLPVNFSRTPRRLLGAPIDFTPDLRRQAARIDAFLGSGRFDAMFVGYSLALSFLGWGLEERCGRIVFQEDDLMLERYRAASLAGANPLLRAYKAYAYRRLRKFFDERLAQAGAIVTISNEEQSLMQGYFPRIPVTVLPYAIPLEDYPLLPPPADRAVLGFIGNYGHRPNRDALAWLLDELFPHLRAGIPGLRLVVAGKGIPGGALRAVGSDPAIRFLEDIGRLEDFYREVGVVINPVRTGRGLRTKLIEAAAFGRPIVSTRLGAEGLEGLEIGLADSREEMLERCLPLLEEHRHRETADANRRAVESRYALSVVSRTLARIVSGGR